MVNIRPEVVPWPEASAKVLDRAFGTHICHGSAFGRSMLASTISILLGVTGIHLLTPLKGTRFSSLVIICRLGCYCSCCVCASDSPSSGRSLRSSDRRYSGVVSAAAAMDVRFRRALGMSDYPLPSDSRPISARTAAIFFWRLSVAAGDLQLA